MRRILVVLFFIERGCIELTAQTDSTRSPGLDALNLGSIWCLGPQVNILYPQQYTFNAEYKLCIRAIPHRKKYAHDHCLVLSAGYALIKNTSFLRLRAGDLLRLPDRVPTVHHEFRIGAFLEYLVGKPERFVNLNLQVSAKFYRMYYNLGVSLPLEDYSDQLDLAPNVQIGFAYVLSEKYTFMH